MKENDFLKSICFVAFSSEYALKVKNAMPKGLGELEIVVTDEENMSRTSSEALKRGKKVFLCEKRDFEKDEKNIYIPVICRSGDYVYAYVSGEEMNNVFVFSDEAETINKKALSYYWNVDVEVLDAGMSAKKRQAFFKEIASLKARCIGPERFAMEARLCGVRYKSIYPSAETIKEAIDTAIQVLKAKAAEDEKNRINMLRMEQYKVVFNFTNDAILATDENGIIIAANDMVYKFLRWNKNDRLEGKKIDTVVKGTKMIKAMEKEGGDIGDVFELPGCTVLTHRIPIKIDGKCRGVVSTFQDLEVLQEHEKNARASYMQRKKGLSAKYTFEDIKGSSKVIRDAKNIAQSYAASSSTVLILGETGTGKELFAQSIHNAGNRSNGPFVAVNCAAIPKNLLESEFFGYEEGSFTGASKGGKTGFFEMAHKGTIFLDEIGEMPLEMQVQLLRVIQEKEVRRIGSDKVLPIDVRVIAATNRDLEKEVRLGAFREDLYYRLNVLELKIPPLRNRREDIKEISESFLKSFDYKKFKANEALWHEIIEELEKYQMRGNIRELQNMLERICVMLENKHINTSAVFYEISRGMSIEYNGNSAKTDGKIKYEDGFTKDDSEQWEKQRIIKALKNNGLSRTKAAEELGISRSTLWNKMKYFKIDV